MRLWHQELIPKLPRQQLLGQHRECCALRGAGWGRKHATVDYVFTHNPAYLVAYHWLVMKEMRRRGYVPDRVWDNANWRGSTMGEQEGWVNTEWAYDLLIEGGILYSEHNSSYLRECIENLRNKGIDVTEMEGLLSYIVSVY